jgi:flagellar biosynthetic protein FliR
VIDLSPLVRLGLLLVRTGVLVGMTPAVAGLYAPPITRIGLALILAATLVPLVSVPVDLPAAGLAVALVREVAIGLALGLAVRSLLAVAELAGHLAGFQLGFSYAVLVDPSSGARHDSLAALYSSLALLTFLGLNGHHLMIRALADSYAALPVGIGHLDGSLAGAVARLLGLVFLFGCQLAAPVLIVLLILELILGLVSRAAPSLNLLVVGAPLRLIVGLLAVSAAIGVVPEVTSRALTRLFEAAGRIALALR